MKKVINRFVSFSLLFIMSLNTFSVSFFGLGNPFDEHPEYYGEMRSAFEKNFEYTRNDQSPYCWEKKPSYLLLSNDYRKIRVYNMTHLERKEVRDNFFNSSIKLLRDAIECSNRAKAIAECSGEIVLRIFKEKYEEKIKGTSEIKVIADFLGTDEKIAINSVVRSIGMTWFNRAAHVASMVVAFSGALDSLTLFNPFLGIAAGLALDVLCYTTSLNRFENEKIENYSKSLYSVWSIMINDPDRVLNSNVLITAVDERDFYNIFRHNSLRRNDESWCDFRKIGDLKCAPLGNSCPRIRKYLDDFKSLAVNGSLSLTKLEEYID